MTDSGMPVLQLQGVAKSFAGVPVLRDINLAVGRGETLVLLGENGAGKSTLKNILCGLLAPDAGTIALKGEVKATWSAKEAKQSGVGAIAQELSLFPNLSVAENVFISELSKGKGLVNRRRINEETVTIFEDLLDESVNPNALVDSLPLGKRQLVEIVKAVRRASSLLILDEPTTSLSIEERQRLFVVMNRLREAGYGLIHVTHFLEEVAAVGDRVAIMRDGVIVTTAHKADLTPGQIEQDMAGKTLLAVDDRLHLDPPSDGPPLLEVETLRDDSLLTGVSFEVRAGEIVGLAGLTGAGRTETLLGIVGLREVSGTVTVKGKRFSNRSPAKALGKGLVLVSEDRRSEQAYLGRSVRENITSAGLKDLRTRFGPFLSLRREKAASAELAGRFDVRSASINVPMVTLSGGNQQKAILARWISRSPQICLLDEPTKGIDVGAKAEVHGLVADLVRAGVGVVLVSSDVEELFALSHRILVLKDGAVVDELLREDFDATRIVRSASTGRTEVV